MLRGEQITNGSMNMTNSSKSASLTSVLTSYLKEQDNTVDYSTDLRRYKISRPALLRVDLNSLPDENRKLHPPTLALKFIDEAFEHLDTTKSLDQDTLETTALCFKALAKNEHKKFDTLSVTMKQLKFIDAIISMEKFDTAYIELTSVFTQIKRIIPSLYTHPILEQMLRAFEFRPMIYTTTIIELVSQFHALVLQWIIHGSVRKSSNNLEPKVPSLQLLMELTSIGSNVHNWFQELPLPQKQIQAQQYSKSFLTLSYTTRTVMKLNLMFKSLEFLAYAELMHTELIDECTRICLLITNKNADLVYRHTSLQLFLVCQCFVENKLSLLPLKPLIEKFALIKCEMDDLNWYQYVDECACDDREAEESFQKLEINSPVDDLLNFLSTMDPLFDSDLIKATELIRSLDQNLFISNESLVFGIYSKVKEMELNNGETQNFVLSILQALQHETSSTTPLTNTHLNLLDLITIEIKNLNPAKNHEFVYQALGQLYGALKSQNQPKRIRNFSNLYFHFGAKLLTVDKDEAVRYWMSCVNVEYGTMIQIDSSINGPEFKSFKGKCERISNLLLETKAYNESLIFLSKMFQCYESQMETSNIFEFQLGLMNDLVTPLKLLAKIMSGSATSMSFSRLGSSAITQVLVVIGLIKLFTQSNICNKQQLVMKLIMTVKNEVEDNGLFLYFLSSVSLLVEFDIKFGSLVTLPIDDSSHVRSIEQLIKSHIGLLMCCTAPELDQKIFQESFNLLLDWANTEVRDSVISDYEFKVIFFAVDVFHNHQLEEYSLRLIDSYCIGRQYVLGDEQKLRFELKRSEISQALKFSKNVPLTSGTVDSLVGSLDNKLYYLDSQLIKLEHFLSVDDIEIASSLFQSLVSQVNSDKALSISGQADRYSVSRLLILLSKFSRLASSFNYKIQNYAEAVICCKRSIRILQSVVKNFLIPGLSNPGLSVSFKCVLRLNFASSLLKTYQTLMSTLADMRLGKEFEYYENEFEVLVSGQISPFIRSYYMFELTKYQIWKNDLLKANDMLSKSLHIYNSLKYSHTFLDLQNLCVNELYYQYVQDEALCKNYSQKFDTKMQELISTCESSEQEGYCDATVSLGISYKSDSRLLIQEWEAVQYRRMMSIFHGSSKQLPETLKGLKSLEMKSSFYKELASISMDPILSSLKDSVISMSSTKPLISSPIKPSTTDNAVACFNDVQNNVDSLLQTSKFSSMEREDLVRTSSVTLSILSSLSTSLTSGEQLKTLLDLEDRERYQPIENDRLLNSATDLMKQLTPSLIKSCPKVTSSTESGFDQLKSVLPSDWLVVSLDICPVTGDLILVKLTSTLALPISVRLPMNRHMARDIDRSSFTYEDAMKELYSIISDSDTTTKYEVTSKVKTKEEKASWWNTRKTLDGRLCKLLKNIENNWLCGFKSLFGTDYLSQDDVRMFKNSVLNILSDHLPSRKPSLKVKNKEFVEINDWVFELFFRLQDFEEKTEELEDLVYFILDIISFHGETIEFDEFDFDQLVHEISKELSIANKKKQKKTSDTDMSHIILVPSMACTKIPWESIQTLRSKSVSRMPSIQMLTELLTANQNALDDGIDPNKGYYVINPSGDLKKTELRFKDSFEGMVGWNGQVGIKPTEQDIGRGLHQSNLYVYIGHGGGEQYVKSKSIKSMERIPPVLLLGCSSGNLKSGGIFKPYGTVYNYLIGGSPMVLANLWDVTDKDIDKFTVQFFKNWGLFADYDSFDSFDVDQETLSAGQSISVSRDVCVLRYLNGAAPVLYGLPLKMRDN
ncbi:hypothetical protein CANARDRAFT_25911 [[Candida] arabinofermentans NRRL YB-2248]|uniref:separase n=1 Tax=[Candida] arabinofermentans NRRL YB-2248 TaxID=983967 RepID=A0A1E4T7N3_9ASCO|nr:hypothetical protein CANARDRAFT_25911 [[Candida] arabinofermentans NRRL YB-2248]